MTHSFLRFCDLSALKDSKVISWFIIHAGSSMEEPHLEERSRLRQEQKTEEKIPLQTDRSVNK